MEIREEERERAIDGRPYTANERPVCKYCGDNRVMWLMHRGTYRLASIEDGEVHECPEYRAAKR